jgi:hypothetical protein
MDGKQFRLAQEIKYIQRRAAQYDARFVTVGPLVFFSTQTKLETPGCWTPPTTSLHDLPEMGTRAHRLPRNQFQLRNRLER